MTSDELHEAHLIDGVLLLEAALAAGLDVELFPRQVMTCWHPDHPEDRWSFVHAVPDRSTLSGVTYAQDKRATRALLEDAGLPVTKAATFSFRGSRAAERFARRVGGQFRIRLAIHDTVEPRTVSVRNWRQIRGAIQQLRPVQETSTASATNVHRSAYSLTGLLDPVEGDDGTSLLAPSTRILVERLPRRARTIHALVIGGEVVAAVERSANPMRGDVTSRLHDQYRDLLVQAQRALPGLAMASVELLVARPDRLSQRQPAQIADVAERPGLGRFEAARSGWGRELATRILTTITGHPPLPLQPIERERSLRFEGVSDTDHLARHLAPFGRSQDRDDIDAWLDAGLRASPQHLAGLLSGLLGPGLDGCRVIHARCSGAQAEAVDGAAQRGVE